MRPSVVCGDSGIASLAIACRSIAGNGVAQPDRTTAAQAAASASAPSGHSGFRAMTQASVALDARLTLIRRAQVSLDLQYYLLGDDEVGHLMLRELRDAAQRGVRVRLLLDDFYTN